MLKRAGNKKALLYIAGLMVLIAFKADTTIVLRDEALGFKPAGYYIAGVVDEGATKNAIARFITTTSTQTIIQTANLEGGTAAGINRFISRNLHKDASQRPVIITIKEIKLNETLLPDKRVDGQVFLTLSFGLQKNYGSQHLINYSGGIHYIRAINNHAVIEAQLRNTIKNGLAYFNNWMKKSVTADARLATSVRFTFIDYTEKQEGDTIYYSAKRPLRWADFQSKTSSGGPYAAEVIPGFGYEEEHKTVNGTIEVQVSLKAYLAKSASWASAGIKDSHSLNHEQRHFDIAQIIAHRYKQKILKASLTPDTYEAFLGMEYLESYRDMHTMQTAYDTETRHGRDHFAQEQWNARIDRELKELNGVN